MLIVTMWHEEALMPDEVIGEVLLHLPEIRVMHTHHTVEDVPTQLMPLHRHPEPTKGPYKVCITFSLMTSDYINSSAKVPIQI